MQTSPVVKISTVLRMLADKLHKETLSLTAEMQSPLEFQLVKSVSNISLPPRARNKARFCKSDRAQHAAELPAAPHATAQRVSPQTAACPSPTPMASNAT